MNKKDAKNMLRPKSRKKLDGKIKAAIKQAKRTRKDVTISMKGSKKG